MHKQLRTDHPASQRTRGLRGQTPPEIARLCALSHSGVGKEKIGTFHDESMRRDQRTRDRAIATGNYLISEIREKTYSSPNPKIERELTELSDKLNQPRMSEHNGLYEILARIKEIAKQFGIASRELTDEEVAEYRYHTGQPGHRGDGFLPPTAPEPPPMGATTGLNGKEYTRFLNSVGASLAESLGLTMGKNITRPGEQMLEYLKTAPSSLAFSFDILKGTAIIFITDSTGQKNPYCCRFEVVGVEARASSPRKFKIEEILGNVRHLFHVKNDEEALRNLSPDAARNLFRVESEFGWVCFVETHLPDEVKNTLKERYNSGKT